MFWIEFDYNLLYEKFAVKKHKIRYILVENILQGHNIYKDKEIFNLKFPLQKE